MSQDYDYDVAVIGAGPGGYVAAIRASQLGARTCVVERDALGGVCTNAGCIPTKALWQTARLALQLKSAGDFGLEVGAAELDYVGLAARRDAVVGKLRKGVEALLSGNGVELIRASAAFRDPHTVALDGAEGRESLSAGVIIIATGSSPVEVPDLPFDHERVIDSADALRADELPESVVIVGGGYIGCEFAAIYGALGAKVTIVEMMDTLLPGLDNDCTREVTKGLKKLGVTVHTGTTVEDAAVGDASVLARLSNGKEATAERMLVCVGRRPDHSGLAIGNAGIEAAERGAITVNEHMQTNLPHVYAIGDVTGRAMLAHMASHEGLVAAAHATGTITAAMDYRLVPACVFAFPEVATVGMTEQEAGDATDQVVVKKFPFRALGKAHILGETDGLVKAVADGRTGELLGVHICGPEASSLLGEACVALQLECTAEELADTIHAHPTLPESLCEAAQGVAGFPVNWRG